MSINAADFDHASAMDRMYRLQRHFYDATRAYYLLGRDRMLEALTPPKGGRVLEIGCGTGRNIIKAADRYPTARLFGLDISKAMLETAGNSLRRFDCGGRVKLAQADATNFNSVKIFDQPDFDRIYFSYTLSMVPDWKAALSQAMKILAPGGELHIVDFGACDALPKFAKATLYAWLRQFHVKPRLDLEAALKEIAAQQNATLSVSNHFRGYTFLAKLTKN